MSFPPPSPRSSQKSPSGARRKLYPFVALNLALTADGKIATSNRRVSSFGSSRDQAHLLELRATTDAVMSGARTVDLNAVNLGPGSLRYRKLRKQRGLSEFNLRVVVSGSGSLDPHAAIFRYRFSPIIVLTTAQIPARRLQSLSRVADVVKICGQRHIDFPRALRWLRQHWGVRHLLCEGGGELNDGLLRAGLVDEINLTVCPRIFAGRHAPTLSDGRGNPSLAQATKLRLKSARRHRGELFLKFAVLSFRPAQQA